jgi:hypothetical protein
MHAGSPFFLFRQFVHYVRIVILCTHVEHFRSVARTRTYSLQVGTVYNVVFASTKLRLDRAIIGIGTSRSRDSPTRDEKETSPHCCTQARTDASCHPRCALPDQRRREGHHALGCRLPPRRGNESTKVCRLVGLYTITTRIPHCHACEVNVSLSHASRCTDRACMLG